MVPLVYFAIPIFLALILAERAWFARRAGATPRPLRGYFGPDTRASLWMGVGNVVIAGATKLPIFAAYDWLHAHRIFDPGTGLAAFALLFFVEDFVYYVWHRASHEIRFLWSAHVNHHSSEYFNLSTALRQSWTTPLTTPLAYWILPVLGFSPEMILTQISISLIYQFWIHTETIDRLPRWFEAVFNTPSHHRVHHGSNVEYLDRNHGGILIVWDRLFGSFEPERAPVAYGLTKNLTTWSPWRIAFHDWQELARSIARPASLATRAAYVFAPPGWSPDGSTKTAKALRAARASAGP